MYKINVENNEYLAITLKRSFLLFNYSILINILLQNVVVNA